MTGQPKTKLNLIGIKCNDEYFITNHNPNNHQRYSDIRHFLFDGVKPEPTFHGCWGKLQKEPERIHQQVSHPRINHRYELIDETMESEKTPLVLKREEVGYYDEREYYWVWKEKYKLYFSLYKENSDAQPDTLEEVEFTYQRISEVKALYEGGFSLPAIRSRQTYEITDRDVTYQEIDKILFPPILLPQRPCSLTPQQTYNIIRQYIKEHIDGRYAEITSDYEFCLTVKKNIKLAAEETQEFYSIGKRKPRKRFIKDRQVKIFEMAPKPYQSYSVIDGFRGKDHKDLKKRIDKYCKELITFINQPLVDCKHCKGEGVILEEAPEREQADEHKS